MPNLTVNNANFYYELHGTGHPLILIAGYTCDHQLWTPLINDLSKRYQVFIFDNRAVGQTKDNEKILSAELMAEDVMALAAKLDLKKPHIVGQSMGGTIAQVIASQYPDQIGKLGILTSSAKWRRAMLDGLKSILVMREKDIDFDIIFNSLLPWCFGEKFLQDKENIAAFKSLTLSNPYLQSVQDQARQFEVLETFDGRSYLKQIRTPTLIVHGIEDVITLLHESEMMAEHIQDSRLVKVDCAHCIVVEAPRQLSQLLIDFLD